MADERIESVTIERFMWLAIVVALLTLIPKASFSQSSHDGIWWNAQSEPYGIAFLDGFHDGLVS